MRIEMRPIERVKEYDGNPRNNDAAVDAVADYIWGGYANCGNYPPALKASKLYFAQAIIWDKEHPVLTRKDFMGAHEWCFYG